MEGWFPDLSSLGPPSRENDDALHRNVRQRPNPPVDMPNNEPVPVFASVDDLEPHDRVKREARWAEYEAEVRRIQEESETYRYYDMGTDRKMEQARASYRAYLVREGLMTLNDYQKDLISGKLIDPAEVPTAVRDALRTAQEEHRKQLEELERDAPVAKPSPTVYEATMPNGNETTPMPPKEDVPLARDESELTPEQRGRRADVEKEHEADLAQLGGYPEWYVMMREREEPGYVDRKVKEAATKRRKKLVEQGLMTLVDYTKDVFGNDLPRSAVPSPVLLQLWARRV